MKSLCENSSNIKDGRIVAERELIIDNTKYHLKSVFIGQTNLSDALTRIIMRRLEHSSAA